MSHSAQGSSGGEGSHTKSVTPARRPDRLRQLIPQALVMACLAGGTCASLAADHDNAVAAERTRPLQTATVAHTEPEPLPRQLVVVISLYPAPGTPAATPAAEPAAEPAEPAAEPAAHPVRRAHQKARRHHHRHGHHHRRRAHRAHRVPRRVTRYDLPRPDAERGATSWTRGPGAALDSAVAGIAGATSSVTGHLNWHGLAHCEAGGRPDAVDPSGTYGGLYQFDARTWHAVGGQGLPQDAPAAEQTRRAMRLYLQRGSNPWPVCGTRLYR